MQTFVGKVISTKMQNTVAVAVDFWQTHKKYQKIIKRTTRLLAHNEIAGLKEGDRVKLSPCRPYSKKTHFKIVEILTK